MITIDGRILDTDMRWEDYAYEKRISDPFKGSVGNRISKDGKRWVIQELSPEEKAYWDEKQNDYLRLMHTFRLWDFHFWMEWEQFEKFLTSETFADTNIYLPCDTVERQCSMACPHFGKEKCPRMVEELKSPIEGIDGRWEYHDDGYYD